MVLLCQYWRDHQSSWWFDKIFTKIRPALAAANWVRYLGYQYQLYDMTQILKSQFSGQGSNSMEEHHSWVFGPHMPSLSSGLSPNSISPAAKAWMAMLTGKPWPRCSSHLDLRLQLGEVPLDVLLQHHQALAVAKLVGGNVNSLSKVLTSPKTRKSFSLVQLFDQWEEGYQVRKHSSTCETRLLKLAEANKTKIHR